MKNMRVKLTKKGVLLAAFLCCLVAAAAVLAFELLKDKTPPTITFPAELRILSEKEYENLKSGKLDCLFEDVTVEDDSGDDLSDRVIARKISVLENYYYLSVNYVAMDMSNNVASRIRYIYLPGYDPDNVFVPAEEEEDAEDASADASDVTEETPEANEPEGPDVRPHIGLSQQQVYIKAGTSFSYSDYINFLYDDTDSYRVLSQNIFLDGAYDVYTPGEYPIAYYVVDSDGNESEPAWITLYVVD